MPRMARHTQTLAICCQRAECPVLSHANANINMSMYSYLSTVLVVAASSVNLVNSQPCWTRRRVCVQLCAVLVLVCLYISTVECFLYISCYPMEVFVVYVYPLFRTVPGIFWHCVLLFFCRVNPLLFRTIPNIFWHCILLFFFSETR